MVRNQFQSDQEKNTQANRLDRRLVILARIFFVVNVVLVITGTGLALASEPPGVIEFNPLEEFIIVVVVLVNGIVAVLILSQYPKHLVGWILLLLSFIYAFRSLSTFAIFIVFDSPTSDAHLLVDFFFWTSNWIWFTLVVIQLIFIPLYFPDGHLLSHRWRIVAGAAILGTILALVGLVTDPANLELGGTEYVSPFLIPGRGPLLEFLISMNTPLLTFAILGTSASVILRYRRAEAVERAQMKWILYILTLGTVLLLSLEPLESILPEVMALLPPDFGNIVLFLLAILVPLTIGIAILRYRLYDIDIIIRRTLVYGVVSMALVAVYFSSVVFLQQLFAGVTDQQSPLAIVISTLLIAALFNPLRRRIQEFVDRRFYRRKYDASQILAQFAQTTRNEVDLEKLVQVMQQMVEQTMQPESLSVWLSRPEPRKRHNRTS